MKLVDVRWFCGATNVAVVQVECPYDGIKYYISAVSGRGPGEDADYAMQMGSRFPNDAGDVLFNGGVREKAL